jgi:hypothetical protein
LEESDSKTNRRKSRCSNTYGLLKNRQSRSEKDRGIRAEVRVSDSMKNRADPVGQVTCKAGEPPAKAPLQVLATLAPQRLVVFPEKWMRQAQRFVWLV